MRCSDVGDGRRAEIHRQAFLTAAGFGRARSEGIMLDAVAKAAGVPVARVRRAAMVAGDVMAVARVLLEKGGAGLDEYQIRVMQPLQPMLAQSAEDVTEALEELGESALEFKLDGARVQVHKTVNDVVVFSRALNDETAAVPEVVEASLALPVKDAILDGEVLSLKPDGRPQPFQITMRRFGRKLDVERMRTELPSHALLVRPDVRRWNGPAQPAAVAAVRVAERIGSAIRDPKRSRIRRTSRAGIHGIIAGDGP